MIGVIGSPLIQTVIDGYGWRTGYLAVAAYVAAVGGLAILLIPLRQPRTSGEGTAKPPRRGASKDYGFILRSRAFWVIAGGMLLCNLIYPLQSSQMKLILLEKGASAETAAWMISLIAAGVMLGRFICGVALDRLPTHVVAAIAMGLPGIGLFAIATGFTAPIILATSVVLMGLSLGAESDLAAYLVIRFFRIDIYGTVLSLVVTALAVSAALGAAVLSFTLALVDNFNIYMLLAGVTSTAGGALFRLFGRVSITQTDFASQPNK